MKRRIVDDYLLRNKSIVEEGNLEIKGSCDISNSSLEIKGTLYFSGDDYEILNFENSFISAEKIVFKNKFLIKCINCQFVIDKVFDYDYNSITILNSQFKENNNNKIIIGSLILTDTTAFYNGDLEITKDCNIKDSSFIISGDLKLTGENHNVYFWNSKIDCIDFYADDSTIIDTKNSEICILGNMNCGKLLSNSSFRILGNLNAGNLAFKKLNILNYISS